MEVHFIARESGCCSDELVVDAVRCHIDGLAYVREMLDRRNDDLENARVTPIDGEEFFENLCNREDELLKKSTP
jgi:hypothetical protein